MVEKTPNLLSQLLRFAKRFLAVLAAIIAGSLITAWIGSSIPRNNDWTEPEDGITIMIESNDVHTAIVMPLFSAQKDWREDFALADIERPDIAYTHISISWGQKDVFLNTPTWGDLTSTTALSAIVGGDALLHVAYYVNPLPSPMHRELRVTPEQYAKLVALIERNVIVGEQRNAYPGYSWYDAFYDAPGTYHVGNTCNQWTSDLLADAGVKTGLWTPFAGGVMKWIPDPSED